MLKVSAVSRLPARMRLINCTQLLSKFVRLDRGAGGEFGWLGSARALLIEAQEMGKVLIGVFSGERPPQFRGTSIHDVSGLDPELIIASVCLRDGIPTMGCGLYTRQFPSLAKTVFFAEAGINRFFYATGKRDTMVVDFLVSKGISITRANA